MGQRIAKTVTNKNVTTGDKFVTTYYVRDPQGNVLAVYEHKHGESGNGTFTLAEQHLYGAGRLGMRKRDLALNATNTSETPATYYELTNHLGNVMAVISDEASTTDEPTVVSLSDYYPYGMTEPGRSWNAGDYRFGYTGHEKENDLAEGVYTTEYRLLDTRLGRWLSVDPLFGKYAGMSPYNYCMGNPIALVDPYGKDTIKVSSEGCVSEIIKSDGENVFLDHKGYRLSFHDEKDVDKKRLTKNVKGRSYDVGDRVYMNISAEDAVTAICSVPQNEDIKNDFFPSYWDIIKASWGGADFAVHFLAGYYDEHRDGLVESEAFFYQSIINRRGRRDYISSFIYFRFEGSRKMYNIYDAGNFMWGAWSVEVGISPASSRIGPEVNEILQGRLFGDSEADRKAIKDGRIWRKYVQTKRFQEMWPIKNKWTK